MRKPNRKDRSNKSPDKLVGKLLELDDLKKVTGGQGQSGDAWRCREDRCKVCGPGERVGKPD